MLLEQTIAQVKQLLPNLNDHEDIRQRVHHLRAMIDTNNNYVKYRKDSEPYFSIHVCTVNQDEEGLLRVNEDPNEMLYGKTALFFLRL